MVTIHPLPGEKFCIIRVAQSLRFWWDYVTYSIQNYTILYRMHYTRRRLTGTPYSSFTYQRNPSDPRRTKSYKLGLYLFHMAPTICCLKLAIAFHTQAIPDRVSHRSSLRVEVPRPNRVCCCLSKFKFCFLCDYHVYGKQSVRCSSCLTLILYD